MGGVDHIVGVRTQTNVNIHEVVVVLINLRKHDAVIVGAEDLAYSAPESAGSRASNKRIARTSSLVVVHMPVDLPKVWCNHQGASVRIRRRTRGTRVTRAITRGSRSGRRNGNRKADIEDSAGIESQASARRPGGTNSLRRGEGKYAIRANLCACQIGLCATSWGVSL